MTRLSTHLIVATSFALMLAGNAASAAELEANVATIQPNDTVPVAVIPADVYLRVPDDPAADIWRRNPEYRVDLTPAPAVHPSVALRHGEFTGSTPLFFSVASDRERLYVKLRWADGTRDTVTARDRFRDGVAVQFALGGGESTSYMMGSTDQPVNIWYWRADTDTGENLAAGGFGSTTHLPDQVVTASSAHRSDRGDNGEWTVVLSRDLEATGDHLAAFAPDTVQPLAFAVWDGAAHQRDGHKRASVGWIKLDLRTLAGN
jgi:DMSO reductase family type II enzyme heme b subunit